MTSFGRVAVTGAGGFIGGRVVEVLHGLGLAEVRGVVRRWSTAARIGRLPVEIVQADLTDEAQAAQALAGADLVVHCAVGDRRATVEGTRGVLAAARGVGVRHVVHLSTIDVYGASVGEVDEQAPLVRTGAEYGDSKIEAEEICRGVHERGLPVTILRPTIVYGPFSGLWTIEFADRLQAGTWMLGAEDAGGTCNLVYVDDVVGAVLAALRHPEAAGEAFNVNGPDAVTWFAYFQALNDAMGLPPLVAAPRARAHLAAAAMMPVRRTAKWVLRRFPGLVMGLYQRSSLAKRLMRGAESAIRQTPTAGEFRLYSRIAHFPTGKAQRLLGWHPGFPAADGIGLSVRWLAHHGFLRSGVAEAGARG